MNKTKQEMLELVDDADSLIVHDGLEMLDWHKFYNTLRTLITDSVILSDGEIEGMRMDEDLSSHIPDFHNAALDKIKDMK